MTPHQNTTEEPNTTQPQAFDTPQEVGQWLIENDQLLGKIETAIMDADKTDTPTQEFFRIIRELGGPERGLKRGLDLIREAIQDIEKLKAQYGIA